MWRKDEESTACYSIQLYACQARIIVCVLVDHDALIRQIGVVVGFTMKEYLKSFLPNDATRFGAAIESRRWPVINA